MKAVIVEIKGEFVAALSEDGTFTRMKNNHYAVGQKIEVSQITVTRPKQFAKLSAMAACCALVCGLGVGAYEYMTPAYYVSMDVNPSVEYTLNTFDRVLSVEAVNEDGAEILRGLNLKSFHYKNIDEALRLTLTEMTQEGYFDGSREGGIVLATSGKKISAAEKLAAHLKELVTAQCAGNRRAVSVESMAVNQYQLEEAKTLGVTPGKFLLVQKLMAEHPHTKTLTVSDWLKKPVWEIMAENERLDELDDAAEDAADAAEDAADAAQDDVDDDAEVDVDDDDDADDKPAVSTKPTPPLKQTKPADSSHSNQQPEESESPDTEKPDDSPDAAEKPDPADLPDAAEKPDPTDPPDTAEKPDPADPPDTAEKPDPADPPDAAEKPDPADPPDAAEKPDPADPPDAAEKPDPADPPDAAQIGGTEESSESNGNTGTP